MNISEKNDSERAVEFESTTPGIPKITTKSDIKEINSTKYQNDSDLGNFMNISEKNDSEIPTPYYQKNKNTTNTPYQVEDESIIIPKLQENDSNFDFGNFRNNTEKNDIERTTTTNFVTQDEDEDFKFDIEINEVLDAFFSKNMSIYD